MTISHDVERSIWQAVKKTGVSGMTEMTGNIMRVILKILAYICIIFLFIYLFLQMSKIGCEIFADEAKDSPQEAVEAVIVVEKKESILQISKDLAEQKIIKNPYLFAISIRCMDCYQEIQSGEYKVKSSEKPSEILKQLIHEEEES